MLRPRERRGAVRTLFGTGRNRSPRALLATGAAAIVATLVACAPAKPIENLPAGADLVKQSAAIMRDVQSAHVAITTDGKVADLPVKKADADLKRNGDAQGTLTLIQFGLTFDLRFVILGDTLYTHALTGGWTSQSKAGTTEIYDTSAILDPDRGVAKILDTATDAKTELKETIDGRDAYRVSVSLDQDAVSQLVPGVTGKISAEVWIDKDTKQLSKVKLTVPGASGDAPGTFTIVVTKINADVTISAPSN
jgi:lipoprotein LprG